MKSMQDQTVINIIREQLVRQKEMIWLTVAIAAWAMWITSTTETIFPSVFGKQKICQKLQWLLNSKKQPKKGK